MELEQYGLADAGLINGERIQSAINLSPDTENGSKGNKSFMLLTDHRVIHINGDEKNRQTVFASIQDIDVVEVAMQHEGTGAYIWAGLAFLVAILLFNVIDNGLGKYGATIIVILMGIYLIVDRLMSPGNPVAVFKTGSSEIRCSLPNDETSQEIYPFINHLFQMKNGAVSSGIVRNSRFAPR